MADGHGRNGKQVCVIVLGDVGRSPRIQYHALSLAKQGFRVDLLGYKGSQPCPDILNNSRISIKYMNEPPNFANYIPRLFSYFLKVLWQSFVLFFSLLAVSRPSHFLIQNPPSVPTLAIVWFVSVVRGSHVVIDWHNYGYSILSLTLGGSHPLVRFSKWFERYFGKKASYHLCVTKAMREDLISNWGIKSKCVTLYDRPPDIFQTISTEDKHFLFRKLSAEYSFFKSEPESDVKTAFTEELDSGNVINSKDRPALLISSTSWTEDEDFSILLKALEEYERVLQKGSPGYPKIKCVITGKGPLKNHYIDVIKSKQFSNIQFCTPWVNAEDYPKLIASADLGVCLHTSSSGLDLPMKVVDMFGCGIPVCAFKFQCLNELVRHEVNGLVFHDHEELAQQLQTLLSGYPDNCAKLDIFRKNLQIFQNLRWDQCWEENALPLFTE